MCAPDTFRGKKDTVSSAYRMFSLLLFDLVVIISSVSPILTNIQELEGKWIIVSHPLIPTDITYQLLLTIQMKSKQKAMS